MLKFLLQLPMYHLDGYIFACLAVDCLHDSGEGSLAELVGYLIVAMDTSGRGTCGSVPVDVPCAVVKQGRVNARAGVNTDGNLRRALDMIQQGFRSQPPSRLSG